MSPSISPEYAYSSLFNKPSTQNPKQSTKLSILIWKLISFVKGEKKESQEYIRLSHNQMKIKIRNEI
jgi:hypothetical protein